MTILIVAVAVLVFAGLVAVALWVRRIDADMLPPEKELSPTLQRQAQLGIALTSGGSFIGH